MKAGQDPHLSWASLTEKVCAGFRDNVSANAKGMISIRAAKKKFRSSCATLQVLVECETDPRNNMIAAAQPIIGRHYHNEVLSYKHAPIGPIHSHYACLRVFGYEKVEAIENVL